MTSINDKYTLAEAVIDWKALNIVEQRSDDALVTLKNKKIAFVTLDRLAPLLIEEAQRRQSMGADSNRFSPLDKQWLAEKGILCAPTNHVVLTVHNLTLTMPFYLPLELQVDEVTYDAFALLNASALRLPAQAVIVTE